MAKESPLWLLLDPRGSKEACKPHEGLLEVHTKIGVALTLARFAFVVALAASTLAGTKGLEAQSTAGESSEKASQTGSRQTMSQSISTLLTRNLNEVFGENDAGRRRAAVEEIYAEDVVFYGSNKNVTGAATRSIWWRARLELNILTFDIR